MFSDFFFLVSNSNFTVFYSSHSNFIKKVLLKKYTHMKIYVYMDISCIIMYYVYICLDIFMFLYKKFFTGFEDQYTIRMQA